MKLYEINEAIEDLINKETGEITDESAMAELELARDEKIHNIAAYIINLRAEAAAAKERAEVFTARRKAAENKAESLKHYLENQLAGQKWSDDDFKITWRKSEKTEVYDESVLPMDYKIPQPYKLDIEGIKKTIKMGKTIPGARIIENQNMQLK